MFLNKKILVGGLIIFLLLLVVVGLALPETKKQIGEESVPSSISQQQSVGYSPLSEEQVTPTVFVKPTIPETSTIEIKEVKLDNFFEDSKEVTPQGDRLIVDEEGFDILYFPQTQQFLISVLGSPFDQERIKAENKFLDTLGIAQNAACKLDVIITTPKFANPDKTGVEYKLSFCE